MKIYIHEHGVLMAGKAWEINAKLKEAKKSFQSVEEWVHSVHMSARPTLSASATAKKKAGSSSYLRPIV
ncbi:Z-ring formation inhibitor MciZ [bacterium LRH843]|nr:Z-ring formation inhibitor MciZ [bacterium LRH843]